MARIAALVNHSQTTFPICCNVPSSGSHWGSVDIGWMNWWDALALLMGLQQWRKQKFGTSDYLASWWPWLSWQLCVHSVVSISGTRCFSCIFLPFLLKNSFKQCKQLQKNFIYNWHLVSNELSYEDLHKNHSDRGSFVLGVLKDSIFP